MDRTYKGYALADTIRSRNLYIHSMSWIPYGAITVKSFIRGNGFLRVPLRHYAVSDAIVKPVRIINQPPGLQILISERAAKRLADIYKDSSEVLKISVESGGCHGFQYNMKLLPDTQVEKDITEAKKNEDKSQQDDDDFDDDFHENKDVVFVLPENNGKVVVDENSLKILNQTTLTYSSELIGSTFKITGGNMKSSCGCGSSFDVEPDK